jgi:hypothetical protein
VITVNLSDSVGSFIGWVAAWKIECELLLDGTRITAEQGWREGTSNICCVKEGVSETAVCIRSREKFKKENLKVDKL